MEGVPFARPIYSENGVYMRDAEARMYVYAHRRETPVKRLGNGGASCRIWRIFGFRYQGGPLQTCTFLPSFLSFPLLSLLFLFSLWQYFPKLQLGNNPIRWEILLYEDSAPRTTAQISFVECMYKKPRVEELPRCVLRRLHLVS